MSQQILLKKSSVANRIPLVTDLAYGEVAINYTDVRLYVKSAANVVTAINDWSNVFNKPVTLAGYGITDAVAASQLGVAYGVATLDGTGHVTMAQVPASLIGGLNYQGTWNATTNTPTLASGTGTKGSYYKVGTAGTTAIDGLSQWNAGDSIVFDGTTWDKIDGIANEVISVNGRSNVVTLTSADVNLGNVLNVAQLPATQTLAVTGDATTAATSLSTGTIALALAASGVTAGTYDNTATQHNSFTVDAKGRVTNVGAATLITPAFSSITATPITTAGYGITDAQALNAKLTSISALSSVATGLVKLTNGVASFDSSSYITGNQSITFSGDATGTGTTAVTLTIAVGSVTLAKMASMATGSLIYRKTAGTGAPEVNTLATLKTDLGLAGSNSGDQTITLTGDATGSGTGSFVVALAASGVTAGTYNNTATQNSSFTVDAKGRVTSVGAAVTIAPAFSSITATPVTVAGYGIADALTTSSVIDGGSF